MTNIKLKTDIKAIIFDSDDTILDFSKVACPVIQEVGGILGMRIPHADEINQLWGIPLKTFIKKLWPDVDIPKFKEHYYSIMDEKDFSEIPGAKDTIKTLNKDYTLGVLTTKPERLMLSNFKDAGFDLSFFKFMHGADHAPYRKPDPKVFDKSLEVLGFKPENVLYVGDSMFDMEAAINAGLNFVAVETGFYKRDDFIKNDLNENNIISSVKELPNLLR